MLCAPLATAARSDERQVCGADLMTVRSTGTIKYWNETYGFIGPDKSGEPDRFFHVSGWVEDREPRIGDPVTFVAGTNARGPSRCK